MLVVLKLVDDGIALFSMYTQVGMEDTSSARYGAPAICVRIFCWKDLLGYQILKTQVLRWQNQNYDMSQMTSDSKSNQ